MKRTQKEIEKDLSRIKAAAQTACSIQEVVRQTQLSTSQVNTTLAKHPIVLKRVMNQLKENQEARNQEAKGQKEAQLSREIQTTRFVIDASITNCQEMEDILAMICATGAKIVITSITLIELDRLKIRDTLEGRNSRAISRMALEKPNSFELTMIERTSSPDASIISYCRLQDGVTLLSNDNNMLLSARMHKVDAYKVDQYFPSAKKGTAHQEHHKKSGFDSEGNYKKSFSDCITWMNGLPYVKLGSTGNKKLGLLTGTGVKLNGLHKLQPGEELYFSTDVKADKVMVLKIRIISSLHNSISFSINEKYEGRVADLSPRIKMFCEV